jgi:hypothetical protein
MCVVAEDDSIVEDGSIAFQLLTILLLRMMNVGLVGEDDSVVVFLDSVACFR